MNKLDKDYKDLLQDILDNGAKKGDRTGTGTLSVFGRTIRHKMSDGFPLLTTKKIPFRLIAVELLWFLRGETNIKFLVDNNCHIWDGDAYKNYTSKCSANSSKWNEWMRVNEDNSLSMLTMGEFIDKTQTDGEFAEKWGDLGPIYGKQWRRWDKFIYDDYDREFKDSFKINDVKVIDQIQNLINDLKTNPDSRRLKVTAWNPAEVDEAVLPPCHTDFQCYTRELSWKERRDLLTKEQYSGTVADKNGLFQGDFGNVSPFTDKIIHYWLDCHNIPKRAISLLWNQRSADTFLGVPFNIASYGLLLSIIANEVNMVPDELIGNFGDTHLYLNHLDAAREQIGRDYTYKERYDMWLSNNYETGMEKNYEIEPNFDDNYYEKTPKRSREPYKLPTLRINSEFWNPENVLRDNFGAIIKGMEISDFQIENYVSHPTIKAGLSN